MFGKETCGMHPFCRGAAAVLQDRVQPEGRWVLVVVQVAIGLQGIETNGSCGSGP